MNNKYLNILNQVVNEHNERKNYTLNSKILLIDGLNNYIRTWVVQPTVNDNGMHVGGIVGFLKTLGLTIRLLNPTRVIIIFDGKNGSSRRKKIYKNYKAHRGHGLRLNRVHDWSSDEEENKQMIFELKRVIEYLKLLPLDIILIDQLEADDVIGYITTEFHKKEEIKGITIVSTDKDFYQLLNDKVNIWNPVNKKLITKQTILDKFLNIKPHNFLLYRAVQGDKSDGIAGINGIGLKTLIKYIPIITSNDKLTSSDIIEYVQSIRDASSVHKKLLDNSKQYKLNIKLMDLSGSFISSGTKLQILDKFKETNKKLYQKKLEKLFLEDRLQGSFSDFISWLNINFSYLNSFRK